MAQQNYRNHRRIAVTFHIFTLIPTIALLIGSIRNLVYSSAENMYEAALLVLVALMVFSLYYHTRSFALKVQDRAIRSEEGLRHFILTGRRLDPRLDLQQIIALRFASDEEFPALAQRAAEEGLGNDAIKKQIRNWRQDIPRV